MGQKRTAAIIVLFHPELQRLQDLCAGVQNQVDGIWLIDNTPHAASGTYTALLESRQHVTYRNLGENTGIAFAQNAGIREALAEDYSHVLLLDQDSLLSAGTVATLLSAEHSLLARGAKVAAVGPVFLDEKTQQPSRTHHHTWFWLNKPLVDIATTEPLETDWLIASGSLIQAEVFQQVGLMREELFIDAVDMEWGLRAKSLGLQSFVIPQAQIAHNVGDSFARLFGVSVILHGPLRNYYIARNWLYLLRFAKLGARWRSGAVPHVLKFILIHTWFTKQRLTQLRMFTWAVVDGLRGHMGRSKR